jgi:hypothetical protein
MSSSLRVPHRKSGFLLASGAAAWRSLIERVTLGEDRNVVASNETTLPGHAAVFTHTWTEKAPIDFRDTIGAEGVVIV